MNRFVRPAAVAFGAGLLAAALATATSTGASAQATAKQAAPAKEAAPATPVIKQMALTEQQIQGVLDAHKEIDAIAAKMPDDPKKKPDPKLVAQLEDTAKKYGFASSAEYNDVVENISLVLAGMDPKSKTYVGSEALLKTQIAAVEADTKLAAKDKKAALDDLNEALKITDPPIENKGNTELVTKYYDKLSDALEEDE